MRYCIVIIVMAFFVSCSPIRTTQVAPAFPTFSAEGHRGARGLYPENSIGAMKLAIDLPQVTTLEMDCHITKDQKVVVYHDDYINPKFITYVNGEELSKDDSKKPIYSYTYEQLNKFDIGSKDYKEFPFQKKTKTTIALLSDLIEEAEHYARQQRNTPMFYNIEVKSVEGKDGVFHPAVDEFADLMLKVIIGKGIANRTVIQSFDKRAVQHVHKKYPQVKVSYLIGQNNKKTIKELIADLGFSPFIISPNYKLVNREFLADAHQEGIKIIPWTVNASEEIESLRSLGVDGIITDYPHLL